MAHQVHFAWQVPPGSRVWYIDRNGVKKHGIVCTTEERERFLNTWESGKQFEICVAHWGGKSDPHWMRLSKVWIEGNECSECGEFEAPPDDYLCRPCRRILDKQTIPS